MNTTPEPPPILAPEGAAPPPLETPPKNAFQRLWAKFVGFVAVAWKFVYPVFKLAKGGKLLLTAGSMLASVWFYSMTFGWSFAIGFVICIFIHEMGHVFAAWRLGMPVSTPIFIPGMGALILSKRIGRSAWEGAVMGYGGPLFGTLAALGCWGLYGLSGNALFLGLAFTGFFMNLFNMTPVFPLDGGWITGAVSPYIWVAGLVGLVALVAFGIVHNPLIWLLVILSLPRMVAAFKRGTLDETLRTTGRQRAIAGVAYIGLCAFLAWGMAETHAGGLSSRRAIHRSAVQ